MHLFERYGNNDYMLLYWLGNGNKFKISECAREFEHKKKE